MSFDLRLCHYVHGVFKTIKFVDIALIYFVFIL